MMFFSNNSKLKLIKLYRNLNLYNISSMSMNLSPISGYGSLWTAQSKYIIDFQRGLVTHSKTLTKGQFNRWVSNNTSAQRTQFNPRQAFKYYTNYVLAQKYLLFIKNAHNNQISKLIFQASSSYVFNHKDEYEKIDNQLAYPMVQMPYGGFVRTKLERDNLVKYVGKIQAKINTYGMNWWDFNEKEEATQRTYASLREIAFKPRQKVEPVSSKQIDQ